MTSLAALLIDSMARHAERTAVVDEQGLAHTYRELDELSGETAAGLAAAGARPGDVVGLLAPRSWWRCVAVVAVWRSGMAVNGLDPELPAERVRRLVAVSDTRLILGGTVHHDLDLGAPVLSFPDVRAPSQAIGRDGPVAYTVGTSGSTGTPKCVAVPPKVLARLARWHVDRWLGPAPRTAHLASPGFDVNFQELVVTWAAGSELVIFDDHTRRDPFRLLQALQRSEVARAFLTPTSLRMLAVAACTADAGTLPLRQLCVAGERLVINDEIRALFSPGVTELVNQYGPSETHVVTEHRLGVNPHSWPALPPLGTSVADAGLWRLDDDELVPFAEGDEAELVVSGPCLAHGYLGDDDLTRRRFGTWRGPGHRRVRAYRTGDVVRQESGVLHFVGRVDDQIKIRGYRVEPGDIEAVLQRIPGVRDAAVSLAAQGIATVLRGHLIIDPAVEIDAAALRRECAAALPAYMVPAQFFRVAEFPITPNGKVARQRLGRSGTAIR